MTIGDERSPPKPPTRGEEAAAAEATRKIIRDFVETPPVKTMADVKAASEVYEANAEKMSADAQAPQAKTS